MFSASQDIQHCINRKVVGICSEETAVFFRTYLNAAYDPLYIHYKCPGELFIAAIMYINAVIVKDLHECMIASKRNIAFAVAPSWIVIVVCVVCCRRKNSDSKHLSP